MEITTLAREGITDLKLYVPGKSIESVMKEYGVTEIVKLASNENPLGASPKAVEAMINAAKDSNLYPDPVSTVLSEKLGKMLNVEPSQIMLSNGMDNILALISQAFVNSGDEVITCAPTFAAYMTNCKIMGGKFVTVPLKNNGFDLVALAQAITPKTKLVFICNPNNPTGTVVTASEVEAFMAKVPNTCIVVFDEAYYEFAREDGFESGMKYVHAGRNVIVTRTFSKLYGLAGCRVGYAVADMKIMNILKRVVEPFPVNRMAQAAANAALDDSEFVQRTLDTTASSLKYLADELTKLGYTCVPSNANFLWADTHRDSAELEKLLLKKGIIIRPGYLWGKDWASYVRISAGTLPQCEKLVAALKEL